MKALFISEETLLDNSIINENVSYTQIRPTVIKVQEMRIQPIVGSPLYGELVTQVVSGSTSALNQTLLEDYIQPAMIQWLYYELPMVLAFKYMNKGMVRRTSEESSQMSMEEITRLTDKVKNDAEWYSERITRYLMENRNSLFGTRLLLHWIPSTRTPPTTAPGWSWTATEEWESATLTTPTLTVNSGLVMTAKHGSA
jgi:hypothetical protein